MTDAARGRAIVRSMAIGLALYFVYATLASIEVIAVHGFNNPGLVGASLAPAVLYTLGAVATIVCLYLGYGWARWVAVAGLAFRSVSIVAVQWTRSHFHGGTFLLALCMAAVAFALVFSPPVREFYRVQNAGPET